MDLKLEVVPVPVSDVDRAKAFYAEKVGFVVDLDTQLGEGIRLVQLTPPGSACSIHLSSGMLDVPPGILEGLQLMVSDIEAARAELVGQGVEASEIQVYGEDGLRPRREGETLDNVGFVCFGDPDGNRWTV